MPEQSPGSAIGLASGLFFDQRLQVVQEMLGHTQISMTMDIYSHVLPSMQQEAMGKLDNVLKRQKDAEERERK